MNPIHSSSYKNPTVKKRRHVWKNRTSRIKVNVYAGRKRTKSSRLGYNGIYGVLLAAACEIHATLEGDNRIEDPNWMRSEKCCSSRSIFAAHSSYMYQIQESCYSSSHRRELLFRNIPFLIRRIPKGKRVMAFSPDALLSTKTERGNTFCRAVQQFEHKRWMSPK